MRHKNRGLMRFSRIHALFHIPDVRIFILLNIF